MGFIQSFFKRNCLQIRGKYLDLIGQGYVTMYLIRSRRNDMMLVLENMVTNIKILMT